jgi:glycine dehydrogenase subunit 2
MYDPRLIFEKDHPGRRIVRFPGEDALPPLSGAIPDKFLRKEPAPLPEVGELDLLRHYTHLSKRNTGVSGTFYPLGSCTMKYNPVFNEAAAAMPGFADLHPFQPHESVQGLLEIFHLTEGYLAEISGMPHISLHPAAGAHGELTALLVIRRYLDATGAGSRRTVLIPDSAHGTNPASCTLCGFKTKEIKSSKETGLVDLESLKKSAGEDTAAIMITNPNTLGLFERDIEEICSVVHDAGGQVYMDGANLNALMGVTRPGDFGIDVMHFNLHKTFSTPHGGGGPGSGPIGVAGHLEPFLPVPRVVKNGGSYALSEDYPHTIGRTRAFFGNVGVIVRAFCYILALGKEGIRRVAENAVLNANYLRVKLGKTFPVPYDRTCMHEFVATPKGLGKTRALDVAKRLIDLGSHPPTIYFPLIVPEALMIEPTETESVDTLDRFVDMMLQIAREAKENPGILQDAPHNAPVGRPDEVRAVKEPILTWRPGHSLR